MSFVSHFSNFSFGGNPAAGDIFVGLRNGINTQFTFSAVPETEWLVVNTSQSLMPNVGFITINGAPINLTLPTVAALGTTIPIINLGISYFTIAQNAGQQIYIGTAVSTAGVTGNVMCTETGDSIYLVCTVANAQWACLGSPQGIWEVN